jgi:solute carrier family 25 carnitine/acylcarnitine transporter 20/29
MIHQEFILGNIFGITQIIIGYPFDTLKTNIQNKQSIKTFLQKPISLYSGVLFPLFSNCLSMSLIFTNYDYFYTTTNSTILSGVLTGFISSFIITPFDYRKIIAQTHLSHKQRISLHGKTSNQNTYQFLIRKYYSGLGLTIAREVSSSPIYFGTFHYCNDHLRQNAFVSGGIAGIASWIVSYPIDTLKTRRQLNQSLKLQQLINQGPLYNGLTITLIRAFIVNSCCFSMYEYCKKKLF